jgi:hypothetical protein
MIMSINQWWKQRLFLANGEPVYSLIIRNWDNITAKVTSEDDAIALYELVKQIL